MPTATAGPPTLEKLRPQLHGLVDQIYATGLSVSLEELLVLLKEALEAVASRVPPIGDADAWFNEEEIRALASAGLSPEPFQGTDDPIAAGAALNTALWATALRVSDAARRLGVSDSRVRQRLAERRLYGLKREGEWRLPIFQFSEDGLIDNIEHVLPTLPEDMHPVAVWNWFLLPKPELATRAGESSSPLDWLRSGQRWQPVAELLRDADVLI